MELMTEEKIGFKRTDVGLIPVDWYLKSLIEIGAFSKGKGIKKSEVKSQGIPCVRYGELYTKHHEQINEFHSFIDENVAKQSRKLSKGDILFAGSGETKKEIGKCVAFNLNVEAYAGGDIVILSPSGVDSNFLGYALNSEIANEQKYQRAQGDAVVHIYSSSLSNLKIPLPPTLSEQQAIASALSDVDELIRSLDGLIQKKQAIKKGTMQQLLTGKKRLPRFDEEWEVKALGESIYIQSGYSFKSVKFKDNGVPIVRISNIKEGYIDLINAVFYSTDEDIPSDFVIEKGEALIAMSGATTGKVGLYRNNKPSYQNQRVGKFVIINKDRTERSFILHLVSSELFKRVLQKELEQGAQPNVSARQIEGLEFNFPEDIEEQKAIAQILSDMDRELQTLRQKREKYVQIKQGMMQELLTGRVRLV